MGYGHTQEVVLPWLHLFLVGINQKTGWHEGLVETLRGQGASLGWHHTHRGASRVSSDKGQSGPCHLLSSLLASCLLAPLEEKATLIACCFPCSLRALGPPCGNLLEALLPGLPDWALSGGWVAGSQASV